MPTPPKRTFSTSSIIELKLSQRLWTRFFVQTRKLHPIDTRFYGNPEAYDQAFQELSHLEDQRGSLQLGVSLSGEILNELAMETAYRLTQAVHTTPMPMGNFSESLTDDTVEDSHLLAPLRSAREKLFLGGENPPYALPAELFSESFWDLQLKAFEERVWVDFLFYMARACFLRDNSVPLALRAIAHLYQGGKGEFSAVYNSLPKEEDLEIVRRAWNDKNPASESVTGGAEFQVNAQHCLQLLGVESKMAVGLLSHFSAYVLGHSMTALFMENPEIAGQASEKHEDWIEGFFQDSSRLSQHERELGTALAAQPATWPIVIAMRSSMNAPFDCPAMSLKILSSNPAGATISSSAEPIRYAYFEGIAAHDPEGAVSIARRRLNALLNGLTYTLGRSPDSYAKPEVCCQLKAGGNWRWFGGGGEGSYPSRRIEEKLIKESADWAAQLLQLSEKNDLAARVIEALRLYRIAKEASDNQQRFSELWLLVDIFLQNTNNPQDDLPLYQMVYAPDNAPENGTPGYVVFQQNRWQKYKKDVEIFWKIRNHGGIHHGKAPRWEERSLRLWTLKLEEAASLALRYCLNVIFRPAPPTSPKECLEQIRDGFISSGILPMKN